MKKSVLTLAIAAAFAAPISAQADTTLYGSARVSVDYNDEHGSASYWDVVNNDSRLGVTGTEDLGGGLSAVYQYEFGVDTTEGGNFNSDRPKFVGLKGDFGTVTLGTQDTPYYGVTGVTDIFNSSKTFGSTSWLGGSLSGSQTGSSNRLDNSVLYATPEFNGFSASAMLVMNGKLNKTAGLSDGVDIFNLSAKYANGPFFAGVTYIALNGNKMVSTGTPPLKADLDLDQWALGLGYNAGPFSVGFIYEEGTYNEWGLFAPTWQQLSLSTGKPRNAYLTASYTFGNNVLSAAYGQLDTDVSGQDNIDNYVLGYQYNLSKRTRLWAEYIGRTVGDHNLLYNDQNAVSVGTRVDF